MFLTTPCNLQNSQSPISARVQARTRRDLAWAADRFESGNQALYELIDALGGNSPYSQGGDAGVPTLGPYGGKPPALQWGGPGAAVAVLPPLNSGCVGAPEVLPLLTVLPIPAFTLPAKSTPVASKAVTPVVVPLPTIPSEDPALCKYTPQTVCNAIRAGCFAAGQVDPRQLAACAASGWQGNQNQFPWLIARGGADGGRPVGFINENPTFPDGRPGNAGAIANDGLSGFEDMDPVAVIATAAVAIFGGAWLLEKISRGRGRR
jgi:hypothetical protein